MKETRSLKYATQQANLSSKFEIKIQSITTFPDTELTENYIEQAHHLKKSNKSKAYLDFMQIAITKNLLHMICVLFNVIWSLTYLQGDHNWSVSWKFAYILPKQRVLKNK